jgi:DNA adenine methylase
MTLKAPFPWFGGKSKVADVIWAALGDVNHYVEPFFGSGAVLLARPHAAKTETINDLDGFVANFWRAVRSDSEAVARYADNPVNECDLHARHLWLVQRREPLSLRLMAEPDYCCHKTAGWWVWGSCAWIGSGFASGQGPWIAHEGELTDRRKLPHLGNAGRGINRALPHLGDAGQGIKRALPHLSDAGQGINRKLPHLGDAGQGINRKLDGETRFEFIYDWLVDIQSRMRDVRVACGDWKRVTGPSVLRAAGGTVGVFLDPPYSASMRAAVYSVESDIHDEVQQFSLQTGMRANTRVVLAGYEGEYDLLTYCGWQSVPWKATGGYGAQGTGRGADNAHKERLFMSPQCLTKS